MLNPILNPLTMPTENLEWPRFENLNKRLILNMNNLIKFKKDKLTWIDSASPLVSLIELLPKSNTIEDYEKLDSIYTQALPLANRFGMATVNNMGKPIEGTIFNGRCSEQWMAILETSNRVKSINDIKPIRCIWHPFTSLNFWMEEEVLDYSDLVSFFVVDLMGLSMVINKFYKDKKEFSSKEVIIRYILPSLVKDIVTITLFNRIVNVFLEQTELNVYDKKRLTPTWYDLNKEVDAEHFNIIEQFNRTDGGYDFIAQNIPLIEETTISNFILNLPEVPTVKNIFSLAFTALSPYINFILSLNKVIFGVENRTLTNALKIELMIMKNDRTLLSDNEKLKNQQIYQFQFMRGLL